MRRRLTALFGLIVCVVICNQGSLNAADSPIDKGSYLVGGMAMLSSMSGDLYESGGDAPKLLVLAPSLSGFVVPGLAIGGQLLVANLSRGGNSLSAFAIGPRIAYYFGNAKESKKIRGRSYPYLSGSFVYGKVTDDWGVMNTEEFDLNAIIIGGGVDYMLTNSIGLVAEVNFRSDSAKDNRDESLSGTSFNVVLGFSMFVW